MKNIQTYEPRHAGGVAAVRSQRRRRQVDLERALILLNARVEMEDLTAISLVLKLHIPAQLRMLAGAA